MMIWNNYKFKIVLKPRSFSFGERDGDRGRFCTFGTMNRCFLFVLLSSFCIALSAQTIQLLDSSRKTSFRGLSVVNDNIVWVSGSNGTIGLSTDAGKSFQWLHVKGYEKTDFRDIEAFDAKTAIIMGIDTPAVILKTTDAGKSWKKVFEDKRPGMFLDAMEFWNEMSGIVVGIPLMEKYLLPERLMEVNIGVDCLMLIIQQQKMVKQCLPAVVPT